MQKHLRLRRQAILEALPDIDPTKELAMMISLQAESTFLNLLAEGEPLRQVVLALEHQMEGNDG